MEEGGDMSPRNITSLPEELLLQIFTLLDKPPPSQLKNRLEPTLDLTSSENETTNSLKALSQVSHIFRRISLPLLFKFSRLHLQPPPETGKSKSLQDLFQSHANSDENEESTFTAKTLAWADQINASLSSYLDFIKTNNLSKDVHSFSLLTSRMIEIGLRFPHRRAAKGDHRYRAAAELWDQLLKAVPALRRVVIVAPPADLACLTNCAIDLFGDWAFEDMGFHILELQLDGPAAAVPTDQEASTTTTLSHVPTSFPGIAASSILNLRPWTHLGLNEGSFLRAYGTYEYFERGPPSLIYSIKECLATRRGHWRPQSQGGMDVSALKSFTYTAILPFANHADFTGLLPYIEEMDIKLAPDPTSGILHDKDRVGKAELGDCWQEFFDAYRCMVRPIQTFDIRPDGTPKLKKFICRDVTTPMLVDELDEAFILLCMPVWAEMEPGVFVRQQEGPPTQFIEIGDAF